MIYGLWVGFAVVAAGTFLGEGRLSTIPLSGGIVELTLLLQLEHGLLSNML